jgi:hypothetical protein
LGIASVVPLVEEWVNRYSPRSEARREKNVLKQGAAFVTRRRELRIPRGRADEIRSE